MSDWPRRFAEALGVEPLTSDEVAAVLDLARDVAHATERRFAPLTTFLAGAAVARSGQHGREDALADAAERVRALIAEEQ